MDWNKADMGEVSSKPAIPEYPSPVLAPGVELDPALPITLGQKMYWMKAAVLEVDQAVEVNTKFPALIFIP